MNWWAWELVVYGVIACVVAVRRWPGTNVATGWAKDNKGRDRPVPPRTLGKKALRVIDSGLVGALWIVQALYVLWSEL